MRFKYVLAFLLLLQVLGFKNAQSQNSPLVELTGNLENRLTNRPQEKVFLHTDRKFYVPGDAIWFQAYLTATEDNLPSILSTNLRVELFSKEKDIIVEQLLFVQSGYGEGVIDLPQDLPGGSYLLRSYTNYMRNFDDEFFFEKEIVIITDSIDLENSSDELQALREIDIQFFPEGGHLVSELPARVAFKAIDNTGYSVDIKGELFFQSGRRLSTLETEHDGMGTFSFIPLFGEDYYVKIEGSEQTFELPKVDKKGYSLYASPEMDGKIKLRITTNQEIDQDDKHFLVIHSNGRLLYSFDINLSNQLGIALIPTDIIPEGIAHITLFDESINPLLERLVFIKKPEDNGFSVSTNKQQYALREKVDLKIKAMDSLGNPRSGLFSLSVIDLGQALDYAPEQTIYSELLLSSDLKGYIDNPMHYFNKSDEKAQSHLDLVMLTHGWVRFSWEDLKKGDLPSLDYFVEQGLTVTGTLFKDFSDKTISKGEITLINNQASPPLIVTAETDRAGRFIFEETVIYESDTIIFRGKNDKGKDKVRFEIDSLVHTWPPFSQSILLKSDKNDPNSNLAFLAKIERRKLIDKAFGLDSGVIVLESFVVESSRLDSKRVSLTKTAFGSGSDAYNLADSPSSSSYSDIFSALTGKFTGVNISPVGLGGAPSISIRQSPFPPLILLDDVTTDAAIVASLNPDSFSRVVLFKGAAATNPFGQEGVGGVLAFYTKGGDGLKLASQKPSNNFLSTSLKRAYSSSRSFYSPKYDVKTALDIKYDQRLVLHWKSLIELDENGEATIEFWNSDEVTSVLLDLQGLMSDGKPIQFHQIYETRKN
ncbi:MAG: hypothetical protein ACJASP_001239 [Roseivirga sp.]|jgi:hypothetical protein